MAHYAITAIAQAIATSAGGDGRGTDLGHLHHVLTLVTRLSEVLHLVAPHARSARWDRARRSGRVGSYA
eukprot:2573469-Rhodomonas_salina.2